MHQRTQHQTKLTNYTLPDDKKNSAATKKVLSADEECQVDEASAACLEYNQKMMNLQKLMEEHKPKIEQLKSLATEIRAVKMRAASAPPAANSPAVTQALQEAKSVESKFGKGSKEAILAWSELEEIASSGLSNAMGAKIDETECLVDQTIDACTALEELNRAMASALN
jgi:hypothetical protein